MQLDDMVCGNKLRELAKISRFGMILDQGLILLTSVSGECHPNP
jgi:hypothetical protein